MSRGTHMRCAALRSALLYTCIVFYASSVVSPADAQRSIIKPVFREETSDEEQEIDIDSMQPSEPAAISESAGSDVIAMYTNDAETHGEPMVLQSAQSSNSGDEAMVLQAGGGAATFDERDQESATVQPDQSGHTATAAENAVPLKQDVSPSVVQPAATAAAGPSTAEDIRSQMEEAASHRDYARAAELNQQLDALEEAAAAATNAAPGAAGEELELPSLHVQGSKSHTPEETLVLSSSSHSPPAAAAEEQVSLHDTGSNEESATPQSESEAPASDEESVESVVLSSSSHSPPAAAAEEQVVLHDTSNNEESATPQSESEVPASEEESVESVVLSSSSHSPPAAAAEEQVSLHDTSSNEESATPQSESEAPASEEESVATQASATLDGDAVVASPLLSDDKQEEEKEEKEEEKEEEEDEEEEEEDEEEEEEVSEIRMLIASCNRTFVPDSYPVGMIGEPLIELAEAKDVTVVCIVSESWAADVNGTMCESMVKEADLSLSGPIELMPESAIKSQPIKSFDAIVVTGCASHHALDNGPWTTLAPLLKQRGLAQISVLNKAHRLQEMRAVLHRLNNLIPTNSSNATNASSEDNSSDNAESNSTAAQKVAQAQEMANVEQAVLVAFGRKQYDDEPRTVTDMEAPAPATQTLLHAPMHIDEMSVETTLKQSRCAGLIPVSLDDEEQYQFRDTAPALEGTNPDDSQLLQASDKLPWESQVTLGDLIRGTARHHTLYARGSKRKSKKCSSNADPQIDAAEILLKQHKMAAAFPTFPSQMTANMSTAFVTAHPLAELDHNVFAGELELGEEPVTVLALGGGAADFAVSTAFQLSFALGASRAGEMGSVVWLDDDLTGERRQLLQAQSDSLQLSNFEIVDRHSDAGEAALARQYSYVHLGELEAANAAETLQWARKAATRGVGLMAHSAVKQESRTGLQRALSILSSVVSMNGAKQVAHAAANLLQHMHPGHRHAARNAALTTGAAIAQATVPTHSALHVADIFDLAEEADFSVAGFHDQMLYSSALATLSSALIQSNATRVAGLVDSALTKEALALGELMNPTGVPVHYVQLSPRRDSGTLLLDNWRMEAVPLPMPTVKTSELARSLEGVQSKVQITCHAQGLNGTMVLPELAGRILKFVDGHRSVGMIYQLLKSQLPQAGSQLFRQQFNDMLHSFYMCNTMYLTYGRGKYAGLYQTSRSPAPRKQARAKGDACATKRCKLRKQKEEQAKKVEDFAWRQKLILEMGLNLMNVDGYQKGNTII